jgi:hypothetical protein
MIRLLELGIALATGLIPVPFVVELKVRGKHSAGGNTQLAEDSRFSPA